jgi:hypothetical protein
VTSRVHKHVVRDGDCIESIAEREGHVWQTVWEHADNSALRSERVDPNVLAPGDVVAIPEIRERVESLATSRIHRFRRKGTPSRLRVQFLDEGEPIAGQPYTLEVAGKVLHGQTDGNGRIDHPIPPRAMGATLTFEDEVYHFALGRIDPITTLRGVTQRLHSLGYHCHAVEPEGPKLCAAVRTLQRAHSLDETGQIDDATRQALQEDYGC